MNFKNERKEYRNEGLDRDIMIASTDIDVSALREHRTDDISSNILFYSLLGFAAVQGIRNLYREIKWDRENEL